MGVPIAHRRPHVAGQRPAYAAKSAETGRTATDTLSRPPPHLRHHGAAKRRGCKNRVLDARSLLRRLHAGHLRPRHHRRTAQGGANHGEHPLPCGIDLSAIRSRWGQRLGQKKAAEKNNNLCKTKRPETVRFRVFLARREGFEPPAFWSVGCLTHKSELFRLRFVLFTTIRSADLPLFPSSPARFFRILGQNWVKRSPAEYR